MCIRDRSPTSWHQLQGCPQAPLPSFPPDASAWITESQGTQWISFLGTPTDSPSLGLWRSTSDTCNINGFVEHGWEQLSIPAPCNDPTNNWSYLFAHPTDPTVVFKGGISLCRSSASGDKDVYKRQHLHDRYVAPEMKGYTPIFRFGHALLIPTKVNDSAPMLFLIDTGAFDNTITPAAAKQVTKISRDDNFKVKGINGEVKEVYRADKANLQFAHLDVYKRQTPRRVLPLQRRRGTQARSRFRRPTALVCPRKPRATGARLPWFLPALSTPCRPR